MRKLLAAAVLFAAPGAVLAQPLPDGERLYNQRCAMCHETWVAGAPERKVISARSHQTIIETLTSGIMKPQATGLKPEEIAALATYLALEKPALANPKGPEKTAAKPKR